MYYAIVEATRYEGKDQLVGIYYKRLSELLPDISGFEGDEFFVSVNTARKAVNITTWRNAESIAGWRNESNHLSVQRKSKDIFESYRLLIGSDQLSANATGIRHYTTLLYGKVNEGQDIQDNKLRELSGPDRTALRKEMISSEVNRGEGDALVWIMNWRTREAASRFADAFGDKKDYRCVVFQVERDYTKTDRRDAPHETPGTRSDLHNE